MNIYKVYHNGEYLISFYSRDAALGHILDNCAMTSDSFEDYEILDSSDFPR